MNVIIIYKEDSDHRRPVQEFYDALVREAGNDKNLTLYTDKDKTAQRLMSQYDVLQYPSILVTAPGDGTMIQMWQGMPLPRLQEVLYFKNN